MDLGIDQNTGIVYEGLVYSGARPLLPGPYLFGMRIAQAPDEALELLRQSKEHDTLLFREDGFDPVSMVRRGRIYESEPSFPTGCRVSPINEAELKEARMNNGVLNRSLHCYHRHRLGSLVGSKHVFAAIGAHGSHSMWRIVSNDRMYLGEELVTMRPLYFLGAIPDLSPDNIPEQWRTEVQDTVRKVVDSMYKADAGSIVDLCRNAASACLFAYLHGDIPEFDKTDLGRLAETAEHKGRRVIGRCAKVLADLHSRGKVNVQKQYNCSPICERDAELAVQCLSFILRDLGYTRSG